jgi:outer membrane immunogenic protein
MKNMTKKIAGQRSATRILPQVLRGATRMPKRLRGAILPAILTAWVAVSASQARAQSVERAELGGEYTFVESNAPPGKCGCFQFDGGTGWFAYNMSRSWAVVGEVGGEHASNINGTNGDFTLSSYLAGPRYEWRGFHRFAPFGQYLIGGAHGNGNLTPTLDGQPAGSNALAMSAGGGVDVAVSRHWAVRLGEVDYFLTRSQNGVNHHQNNLRIGVGVLYRFGGRK